ncbi:hypothetical protein [Chryseobacterium terrae]|uniref:SH3 domain-containing protein n=1 Tax=Chryseobacterium terrae TaxID=3163299 RepID=A0ABW8Y140_9FLAO
MLKKIKIHQAVSVYSNYDENSKTKNFLSEGQIVDFNREKRRNGINWMEIYINNQKAYIKKDLSKIFILKEVRLADDSCNVLFFEPKKEGYSEFEDLFLPAQNDDNTLEEIQIRRVYEKGNKENFIKLYYDENAVDIHNKILIEKDKMIISAEKGNFLEIFHGQKTGYTLSSVSYNEGKDWWIMPLIILIMSVVTIGIFAAILMTGWIVVGPILLIPGFILAVVIIVFLQIIIAILSAAFKGIRKRL